MFGIIYKATGPTGKVYIGQTVNSLVTRKAHHAFHAKKGDRRDSFHIALLTEGFSSFIWEQIDTSESKEDLNAKKKHWIAHYQSDNPAHGYNGTDGGISYTPSPEHRKKLSKALKGIKRSPETRQKMSQAQKGHVVSDITRRKMSASAKCRNRKK